MTSHGSRGSRDTNSVSDLLTNIWARVRFHTFQGKGGKGLTPNVWRKSGCLGPGGSGGPRGTCGPLTRLDVDSSWSFIVPPLHCTVLNITLHWSSGDAKLASGKRIRSDQSASNTRNWHRNWHFDFSHPPQEISSRVMINSSSWTLTFQWGSDDDIIVLMTLTLTWHWWLMTRDGDTVDKISIARKFYLDFFHDDEELSTRVLPMQMHCQDLGGVAGWMSTLFFTLVTFS